jgi:hypothetical protein
MTWVVCANSAGENLQVMSRADRELMLELYFKFRMEMPNHVIKVFDTEEQARYYYENARETNKLIERL